MTAISKAEILVQANARGPANDTGSPSADRAADRAHQRTHPSQLQDPPEGSSPPRPAEDGQPAPRLLDYLKDRDAGPLHRR